MKSKLLVFAVFLSLIGVMALVSGASAGTITISRTSGYYQGSGGEFTILPDSGLANVLDYYADASQATDQTFQSFCLETDEFVSLPGNYNYSEPITLVAVQGGYNTDSGDTISKGTAWLYRQFSLGTLTGYDYTAGTGRKADAELLQKLVWYLEGENPAYYTGYDTDSKFVNLLTSKFGSLAAATADSTGEYGVSVLNLYEIVNGKMVFKQSQTVVTPEPASLLLMGMGLLGAAILARKSKRG